MDPSIDVPAKGTLCGKAENDVDELRFRETVLSTKSLEVEIYPDAQV